MIDMAQADSTLRTNGISNNRNFNKRTYKVVLNGSILNAGLKWNQAAKIVCSKKYWDTNVHIESE